MRRAATLPNARGARDAAGEADERWIPEGLPLDLADNANPAWEGMRFSPIAPRNDVVGGLPMARYFDAMTRNGGRPTPTDLDAVIRRDFLPGGQNALDYNRAFETYGY